MNKRHLLVSLVSVLLVACSAGGPTPAPATQTAESVPVPSSGPTATSSAQPVGTVQPTTPGATSASQLPPEASASTAPVSFSQPWAGSPLVDVVTGTTFTLAELAASGKVVMVEPMAVWCGNCRAQQRAAVEAFEQLDPERVAWVSLDVEPSEDAAALARYRDQNGFPFTYAIADQAMARALADEFGDVVLSPPSVNLIVLGSGGRVTHLLGHHEPAALVAIAAEHGH